MTLYNRFCDIINEPTPLYLLVSCWCCFALTIMFEFVAPVAFGFIMTYPKVIPATGWFELSANLLYVADKLGILLLLFCFVETYLKLNSLRKN